MVDPKSTNHPMFTNGYKFVNKPKFCKCLRGFSLLWRLFLSEQFDRPILCTQITNYFWVKKNKVLMKSISLKFYTLKLNLIFKKIYRRYYTKTENKEPRVTNQCFKIEINEILTIGPDRKNPAIVSHHEWLQEITSNMNLIGRSVAIKWNQLGRAWNMRCIYKTELTFLTKSQINK